MEIRPTVRRHPGAALALVLGLIVALAAVLTLSVGGWGLTIASPAPAANPPQPTVHLQQPPDAQDRNRHFG